MCKRGGHRCTRGRQFPCNPPNTPGTPVGGLEPPHRSPQSPPLVRGKCRGGPWISCGKFHGRFEPRNFPHDRRSNPPSPPPRGVSEGGRAGGGFWLGPSSSEGPPVVPAEGGPKIFFKLSSKSSWRRRGRSKILAVSLKHWKGRRWGGGGGGGSRVMYNKKQKFRKKIRIILQCKTALFTMPNATFKCRDDTHAHFLAAGSPGSA